jgi:hypothetical protein
MPVAMVVTVVAVVLHQADQVRPDPQVQALVRVQVDQQEVAVRPVHLSVSSVVMQVVREVQVLQVLQAQLEPQAVRELSPVDFS